MESLKIDRLVICLHFVNNSLVSSCINGKIKCNDRSCLKFDSTALKFGYSTSSADTPNIEIHSSCIRCNSFAPKMLRKSNAIVLCKNIFIDVKLENAFG